MKPLKTWALIADGGHARILENTGPMHGDTNHGAPGHGVSSHDWRPVEGLAFHGEHVANLAAMLAGQLAGGAYQRLIIAAPPSTLGELRNAISDKVRATIVAEFAHDLTKIPSHEIASHLRPIPV